MKDLFTAKSAGSPAFLSPELCVSSKHRIVSSKAVDIWAMGITLFCLRFGRLPFSAESVLELYDTIRNKPIEVELEIQSSLENISNTFTSLICGLLEKDPNSRITMSQIRVSLYFDRYSRLILL
jgi:[calcium/calmodulin-dependent protein kinase] kinase